MKWNPEIPYNDLPGLPPDLERIETRNVLKACISARAAIAELKTAGELLPDQGLLINILPMLEAKDSSRIENIVTTSDRLFQYADREEGADPATKEALRYRMVLHISRPGRFVLTPQLLSAQSYAQYKPISVKHQVLYYAIRIITPSTRPPLEKRLSATYWRIGNGLFMAMMI